MFNRILALSLLVALLSSNLSSVFVYAGFRANQSYIAKVLCENKQRPWMNCNGRCYLMKKLKEATEKEKKQDEKENLTRVVMSFFEEPFLMVFNNPIIAQPDQSNFPNYNSGHIRSFTDTIFRPPKAS